MSDLTIHKSLLRCSIIRQHILSHPLGSSVNFDLFDVDPVETRLIIYIMWCVLRNISDSLCSEL